MRLEIFYGRQESEEQREEEEKAGNQARAEETSNRFFRYKQELSATPGNSVRAGSFSRVPCGYLYLAESIPFELEALSDLGFFNRGVVKPKNP